jgi:predicted dehydrogenase
VHAPVFQSDARSEVVAICASTEDRARAVADRLNIRRAFGDWRRVVAAPEIAAVSIAVPPALQPEIAIAAARAGKHVFCEKPLARSHAEAQAMLVAVEASGVANAIDFEFGELPAYRAAEQLLLSGQLGAIDSLAFTWEVRTRSRPSDSWKEQLESGGGSLGGFAAHAIYLIERLFAPVVRLSSPSAPSGIAGRRTIAELELLGGLHARLNIATDADPATGHRLEAHGLSGDLVVENRGPDHVRGFTVRVVNRVTGQEGVLPLEELAADGDARVAAVAPIASRFVTAALGGPAASPGIAEGVRVQRVLDALRVAPADGTWIAV